MPPDALPPHWQAVLAEIVANRSGLWVGVMCLPGGSPVVDQLEAFGAVERVRLDPRYATLTPWGAALLGVEPYSWDEGGDPVWMLSSVVEEDERIGERPFVSTGFPCSHRRQMDCFAERGREWFADADPGDAPIPAPEPLEDHWGNVIALFGGVMLYRASDLKRQQRTEAKASRRAKRDAKAARRKVPA